MSTFSKQGAIPEWITYGIEEIVYSLIYYIKERKLLIMEKYYCKVCGKELEKDKKCAYHEYKYVCAKHYQQILKYGHPLDTIQRSTFDFFYYIDL